MQCNEHKRHLPDLDYLWLPGHPHTSMEYIWQRVCVKEHLTIASRTPSAPTPFPSFPTACPHRNQLSCPPTDSYRRLSCAMRCDVPKRHMPDLNYIGLPGHPCRKMEYICFSEHAFQIADFRFQIWALEAWPVQWGATDWTDLDYIGLPGPPHRKMKYIWFSEQVFRISDFRFRISDCSFQVWSISEFRAQIAAFRFWISDFQFHEFRISDFWFHNSDFRFQNSDFGFVICDFRF